MGPTAPTTYDEETRFDQVEPGLCFIDDRAGTPVGIDLDIGHRPVLVGGNSDRDDQMPATATAGNGPAFGCIVHHTDREREFDYDRKGHVGVLNRGHEEGPGKG